MSIAFQQCRVNGDRFVFAGLVKFVFAGWGWGENNMTTLSPWLWDWHPVVKWIPMGESCPLAAARQCCQWFTPYLYKKGSQINVKLCHSPKISMRTCRSDGTPRRLFRCISFTSTGSKPSECAVWATDWYYFRLRTIFHQQELVDRCFQLKVVWVCYCFVCVLCLSMNILLTSRRRLAAEVDNVK